MGRNRPSNEGAPRVPGEERSGPPWGRLAALLIGLILLAVLIPLACQAFGGSGDSGSSGGSADQASARQDQSSGQQDRDSGRQKGADKAASGDGKAGASAAGGSGAGSGGSSEDAEAGDGSGGREAAGIGDAPAREGTGSSTDDASAAGDVAGAQDAADGAGATAGATARIADIDAVRSADGETVTVPRATISGTSGWIAVHADENGEPGAVLGHAPLGEGRNTDVPVPLDRPVDSTQRLHAMVHADGPADGEYTFPDGDPPVTANKNAVVEPFEYAVGGGSVRASAQSDTAAGGANAAGETLPDTGGPSLPALAAGIALLVAGMAALTLGAGPTAVARLRDANSARGTVGPRRSGRS